MLQMIQNSIITRYLSESAASV